MDDEAKKIAVGMVTQRAWSEARTFLREIEGWDSFDAQTQSVTESAFAVGFLKAWEQRHDLEAFLGMAHSEASG